MIGCYVWWQMRKNLRRQTTTLSKIPLLSLVGLFHTTKK